MKKDCNRGVSCRQAHIRGETILPAASGGPGTRSPKMTSGDGCVLHIDIIDGKIWIQHDGSTDGVAEMLMVAGVPQESIVLGFQPSERHQLTAFASA
jgi:hypothetical protein